MDRGSVEKEKQDIRPLLFVLTGTKIGSDMRLREEYLFMKREERDVGI